MGAWGIGLYQDDVTCDVRSDYVNRLKVGLSNIDATKDLIELNLDFIEDPDDGPLFWLALADTQWKYGRLLPEIKEIALEYIRSGTDLEKWKENKKQYEKRKKVLEELFENPRDPEEIIKEKGWIQISDEGAIREVVKKVLEANPKSIADYKAGKDKALGFLVGQAMKETKGKANPQMLNKLFLEEM